MTERAQTKSLGVRGLIGLLAVLTLAMVLAPAGATRDPMQHFFHHSAGRLPEEVARARAAGQTGILVMFEMDGCRWCATMKSRVLNRVEVQDYYRRHFRILALDVNGEMPMIDFSGRDVVERDFAYRHNPMRATPVFVFFGLDGQPLARYTGATRDAAEFLELGEYVASGAWKSGDFAAWQRGRAAGGRPPRSGSR